MATVPPFRSEVDKTKPDQKEKPLEYYDLTGLTWGQLTRLSIMVVAEIDNSIKSESARKKPPCGGPLPLRRPGSRADAA